MADEKTPPGPFRIVSETEGPAVVPRLGPTMAQIVERLGQLDRVEQLATAVLKRLQQTALMVDGFGSTVNRRLDLLHEEAALLRVGIQSPPEGESHPDNIPITLDESQAKKPKRSVKHKAQRAAVLTGKLLSYGTTLAIVLRLVGKRFPDYQETIDALLALVGL